MIGMGDVDVGFDHNSFGDGGGAGGLEQEMMVNKDMLEQFNTVQYDNYDGFAPPEAEDMAAAPAEKSVRPENLQGGGDSLRKEDVEAQCERVR